MLDTITSMRFTGHNACPCAAAAPIKEITMSTKAFQDYYPEEYAHCFGCGHKNDEGLRIKSYWDGEESVCRFTPAAAYSGGYPGNVYGGLIASLMDCHSAGTAAAAKVRAEGYTLDDRPITRFVTASIKVDFLKPTPMGKLLEIRAKVAEIKGRKILLSLTLTAEGELCAKGESVMVEIPEKTSR
jgi:acyl-coenzyme A thioesterase PaaI-like protein